MLNRLQGKQSILITGAIPWIILYLNAPWLPARDSTAQGTEGHQGNQEFVISIMLTKAIADLAGPAGTAIFVGLVWGLTLKVDVRRQHQDSHQQQGCSDTDQQ